MKQVLKKNAYKCVTLVSDDSGHPVVTKAYSNQGAEQDRENTRYIDQALTFFYDNFSNCVVIPKPLGVDLEKSEIQMEYLPNLPKAKYLRLPELVLAQPFFHACYQQQSDAGFLRGIKDSVIMNPELQQLLDSDFPQTLGFKGDLSENLVKGGDELILADIDSICLEPLGLSELIIYADHFSSSWLLPALGAWITAPPAPVAFEYLNRSQAENLINAALAVLTDRMKRVRQPLKALKYNLARMMLYRLLNSTKD